MLTVRPNLEVRLFAGFQLWPLLCSKFRLPVRSKPSYDFGMPKDVDRMQAKELIAEPRASADRLVERSRQLAEEALQMRQRADDLEQLI